MHCNESNIPQTISTGMHTIDGMVHFQSLNILRGSTSSNCVIRSE